MRSGNSFFAYDATTKGQPVWPKRLPRKPKAKAVAKRELKQARKRLAAKPSKLVVATPQPLPKSGKHASRRRAGDAPALSQLIERAKRLQAGRTVTVALMLARFHVFQPIPASATRLVDGHFTSHTRAECIPQWNWCLHRWLVYTLGKRTGGCSCPVRKLFRDLATWQGADCPQSAADWCWFVLQGQGFDTWHCAVGEDTGHGRSWCPKTLQRDRGPGFPVAACQHYPVAFHGSRATAATLRCATRSFLAWTALWPRGPASLWQGRHPFGAWSPGFVLGRKPEHETLCFSV